MNSAGELKLFCPGCGVEGVWDVKNKYRPFCSERCKLIDLGQWANENYRIAGKPSPDGADANPADDLTG